MFSELMIDPERGEVKGFDEEFLDTLILFWALDCVSIYLSDQAKASVEILIEVVKMA